MKTIGMLLGIPDEDQKLIRYTAWKRKKRHRAAASRCSLTSEFVAGEAFAQYVDWRGKNPSDDIMTMLIEAEFEDETGATCRLERANQMTDKRDIPSVLLQRDHHHFLAWPAARWWSIPTRQAERQADLTPISSAIQQSLLR